MDKTIGVIGLGPMGGNIAGLLLQKQFKVVGFDINADCIKALDEFGLTVTVAHYPTGASKWNPIEHRMFSEIAKNWAGVPLESFDIVVNFAENTQTKTGLQIKAYRDRRVYEKGIKVSDKEFRQISLSRNDSLGKWNYTISPRTQDGDTKPDHDSVIDLATPHIDPPALAPLGASALQEM